MLFLTLALRGLVVEIQSGSLTLGAVVGGSVIVALMSGGRRDAGRPAPGGLAAPVER